MRNALIIDDLAINSIYVADGLWRDDIFRVADFIDDSWFGHHYDFMGVLGSDVQIVTDHYYQLVLLDCYCSEKFCYIHLVLDIKIRCGFVQETEAMILDEPTANLDVRHQVYVAQLLREIADKGGKIIIMICHDLNIAARYSSEVIVMSYPGIIERVGTPEEVFDSDLIRRVYGIDCEIVTFEGKPNVMLKSDFVDGDIYD